MLLSIDIGNTSITFGLFKNKKLIKVFRISTYSKDLKTQLKRQTKAYKVDSIIMCSVVPKKTNELQRVLKQILGIKPKVAGQDIIVPIKNLYKNPKHVGQDRLVNAYACKNLYGFAAVVVDFGTATTFDYINKKGAYSGGIIAPGIEISLEALFKKTALLPNIEMAAPKSFLGKSTIQSIRSGAGYGLAFMCDGMINAFRKKYGRNIRVVSTGGLADFFKLRCKAIDIVDKNLTLKGLCLLARHCEPRRGEAISS